MILGALVAYGGNHVVLYTTPWSPLFHPLFPAMILSSASVLFLVASTYRRSSSACRNGTSTALAVSFSSLTPSAARCPGRSGRSRTPSRRGTRRKTPRRWGPWRGRAGRSARRGNRRGEGRPGGRTGRGVESSSASSIVSSSLALGSGCAIGFFFLARAPRPGTRARGAGARPGRRARRGGGVGNARARGCTCDTGRSRTLFMPFRPRTVVSVMTRKRRGLRTEADGRSTPGVRKRAQTAPPGRGTGGPRRGKAAARGRGGSSGERGRRSTSRRGTARERTLSSARRAQTQTDLLEFYRAGPRTHQCVQCWFGTAWQAGARGTTSRAEPPPVAKSHDVRAPPSRFLPPRRGRARAGFFRDATARVPRARSAPRALGSRDFRAIGTRRRMRERSPPGVRSPRSRPRPPGRRPARAPRVRARAGTLARRRSPRRPPRGPRRSRRKYLLPPMRLGRATPRSPWSARRSRRDRSPAPATPSPRVPARRTTRKEPHSRRTRPPISDSPHYPPSSPLPPHPAPPPPGPTRKIPWTTGPTSRRRASPSARSLSPRTTRASAAWRRTPPARRTAPDSTSTCGGVSTSASPRTSSRRPSERDEGGTRGERHLSVGAERGELLEVRLATTTFARAACPRRRSLRTAPPRPPRSPSRKTPPSPPIRVSARGPRRSPPRRVSNRRRRVALRRAEDVDERRVDRAREHHEHHDHRDDDEARPRAPRADPVPRHEVFDVQAHAPHARGVRIGLREGMGRGVRRDSGGGGGTSGSSRGAACVPRRAGWSSRAHLHVRHADVRRLHVTAELRGDAAAVLAVLLPPVDAPQDRALQHGSARPTGASRGPAANVRVYSWSKPATRGDRAVATEI